MEMVYYDDIELHKSEILGDYLVDKEEAVEFAKKWDPQLFHIDEEAAKSLPTKGLIVSAVYTLAVITRLGVMKGTQMVNLAGLGLENVRFPIPIRPGDHITVSAQVIEKRESKNRPDAGIVRSAIEVKNQNGQICFTLESINLVAKRHK